jgi:hypothetical protein
MQKGWEAAARGMVGESSRGGRGSGNRLAYVTLLLIQTTPGTGNRKYQLPVTPKLHWLRDDREMCLSVLFSIY